MAGKKRKLYIITALIMLTVLLFTACGGEDKKEDSSSKEQKKEEVKAGNDSEGSSKEQEKTDKKEEVKDEDNSQKNTSFVVPIAMDLGSLSPLMDDAAVTKGVLRNMHDAIYKYNPDTYELELSLAEKTELSDDGRSFTVTFKKGVKFHNGSELKADDVIYSFNRLAGLVEGQEKPIEPNWGALLNPEEGNAGSIEKIDDYTVEFKYNDALLNKYASNLQNAFADAFIVPADVSEEEQARHPIGAGPYKFDEYLVADHINLSRFEDYHGNKPDIKNVEFRIYGDANSQLLAFKTGEINLLELNNANYSTVAAMDGVEIISDLSQDVRQIWLNQGEDSKFHDLKLRQAMNYAVNKDEVIKIVNEGRGKTLDTHLSTKNPFYNDKLKNVIKYDPEKAKELIAEAGYPDGFEVDYYVVSENNMSVDIATVVAEQLKAVGITANIKAIPWQEYYPEVYKGKKYEMAQLQIVAYPDAYRMLSRFRSAGSNVSNHQNPEYDEIMLRAGKTTDPAKLKAIMQEAQQSLVDDSTNVFIMDQGVNFAISSGFTNYKHYPFAFTDISSIKVK